ncbi:MAG: cell division protein FtsZ [Firmicutes bacterium]|nr:cell division protein FtsZ [Candidatus Fiminaster equi]
MDEQDLDNYEAYARIVVIGVGGAGNNAVNRMIDDNISSVEFYVANTDQQALSRSKAKNRIILGQQSTGGLGAGGDPEVGRRAAEESIDKIREVVAGANLVFIAAGMGGGTGTGAAPVIAAAAKEAGALTVAIVTRPFTFEGKKRIANSVEGLNSLKDSVDAIIIVSNDKLLMVSGTARISDAFAESDAVLSQSVKTVTDLILCPAFINLDFADVRNTLKDSGISLIGYGFGEGPNRSQEAANNAINSPLLEASINGARRAICAVTCGPEVSLYEAQETVNRIIEAAGSSVDIKFGVSINEGLSDKILVSVIASDFTEDFDFTHVPTYDKPAVSTEPAEEVNMGGEAPSAEAPHKEEDVKESFLPNFLKDKNL